MTRDVIGSSTGTEVPCPECGVSAAVVDRSVLGSTDGPVEHVRIRCPGGHHLLMPTERLDRRVAGTWVAS